MPISFSSKKKLLVDSSSSSDDVPISSKKSAYSKKTKSKLNSKRIVEDSSSSSSEEVVNTNIKSKKSKSKGKIIDNSSSSSDNDPVLSKKSVVDLNNEWLFESGLIEDSFEYIGEWSSDSWESEVWTSSDDSSCDSARDSSCDDYSNESSEEALTDSSSDDTSSNEIWTSTSSEEYINIGDESTKEILLSGKKSGSATVSIKSYDSVNKHKWHQSSNGKYASGTINGKIMYMHRFIMNDPEDMVVDHINGDGFDNRLENLRITTTQMNCENKKISKSKKSSSFRGVFYDKKIKKYYARTRYNKVNHWLGNFESEIEAATEYDMHIVHKNVSHKTLNFPEKREEYLKTEYKLKIAKGSKYYGVRRHNTKYRASVQVSDKPKYSFTSTSAKKCAYMRDKYIVDNNIPSKKLNFPDKFPDYNPNTVVKTLCENIGDGIVKLLITNDHGKTIKISEADYDKIKWYPCHISSDRVNIKIDGKTTVLPRFLLDVTNPKIYVDHIDSDPCNNTRENLRLSDAKKNAQNKSKALGTTSKYNGIYYNKKRKKWHGRIKKNGSPVFSEYYSNEEYCARHRDLYIINYLQNDTYKLCFVWDDADIKKWTKKLNL